MDSIVEQLKASGFVAQSVVDEEFPALKGEYAAIISAAKPWHDKESGALRGYQLTVKISETKHGDAAEGRLLSKFYKTEAGKDWQGNDIPVEKRVDALKDLCNDVFTISGTQLDYTSPETIAAGLADLIDKSCFIRAWHYAKKDGSGTSQSFTFKQEKHLKKAGKASGKAPF